MQNKMKSRLGKRFVLVPIGLCLMVIALVISQRTQVPDAIKGVLFGVSIGIMLLSVLRPKRKSCCTP